MAEKTYGELLKDPRWQRKRLEIFQRDGFMCSECESDDKTLHVHHKRYRWGKRPWEYDNDELLTLCEGCHELATSASASLKEAVALLPSAGCLERLAGYAIGTRIAHWFSPKGEQPPWIRSQSVKLIGYEMAVGISEALWGQGLRIRCSGEKKSHQTDELVCLVIGSDGVLRFDELCAILEVE